MIIDVRKSIMKQLKFEFPDHKVYGEKVEQGLQRPCFFVDILPIDVEKFNKEFQKHLITVDIQYMSKEDTKEKNLEMASLFPQVFDYVLLENGNQIKITNEQFETIDGILHYLFDLEFMVKLNIEDDEPMIGEININVDEIKIEK